ncbi:MAG TPA: protease pro-enzyme activation domain-containing protein, partial [Acidimicrobiales bacterium]
MNTRGHTVMQRSRLGLLVGVVVLGVGVLTPLASTSGGSTGTKVALSGDVPTLPAGTTRLGPLATNTAIHTVVSLVGQDPTGLAQEVAAVSTPGSPTYHQYLTSAQYAAAYGPSATEVSQVTESLRAEGLTVGTPNDGSTLLPVSGTAAAISSAFDTPLESVLLPSHVNSFANTEAPQIPASIAGDVDGIVGLSGLSPAQSMVRIHKSSASTTTPTTDAHPNVVPAVTGAQCAGAVNATSEGSSTTTQLGADYGLNQLFAQGRTGIGETIAVVE